MTFTLEVSRPFQWRPGVHHHRGVSRRAWWGFVAVGVITIPYDVFATTAYDWKDA